MPTYYNKNQQLQLLKYYESDFMTPYLWDTCNQVVTKYKPTETLTDIANNMYRISRYGLIHTDKEGIDGYFDRHNKVIAISDTISEQTADVSMLHELCHYFQFQEGLYSYDSWDSILYAEEQADVFAMACAFRIERYREKPLLPINDWTAFSYFTKESQEFLADWYGVF